MDTGTWTIPGIEPVIVADGVNHWYGTGNLRSQALFDINLRVLPGEIVILTGPSGSGKTTLLTLLGALRSTQEGSLQVLGQEMHGSSARARVGLRQRIGYIFQAHNLLASLTARDNVELAVRLSGGPARERSRRALELLEAVGLGGHAHKHPRELSGGQRQRVAVARALAVRPRIVLADEPTASLDRGSGKEVVELLQALARQQESAVVIVTHDNRILDVADRIVQLEDGRLSSFTNACADDAQRRLDALARTTRRGELAQHVRDLDLPEFASLLEELTDEFRQLLQVLGFSRQAAFESMLEQVLDAFTLKIGDLLEAERATLFVRDEARGELWSKVAAQEREIRISVESGIAGYVARTGRAKNVPDAYAEPLFDRSVDEATGYRTRSLLCLPILDSAGHVFAVMQLLNKSGGQPFDTHDEDRFRSFSQRLAVILETWASMRQADDVRPS
jgi:putative ABC transport system ATP-binding protein